MSRGRKPGQGKFEGGRKPLPEHDDTRRVSVNVRLPLWLSKWLKRQKESQGRLIEKALIETYKITANDWLQGRRPYAVPCKPLLAHFHIS